jgi:hypothetical protein
MWSLDNRTPYAAGRNWTRDKKGSHHWLVAVRASFDITAEGRLKLADEQQPPALEPAYRGEPASSSLRWESDLLAIKPGTDVLLEASAYAPAARPTVTVPVSMRVDDLRKTVLVHGTRVYYKGMFGLTTSPPRPFTTRPIVYEWAFGGADKADPDPREHRVDARNPIGKGFAVKSQRLVEQPAHAIEYPQGDPARTGPAGFGPISPWWMPRLKLAGVYDERWAASKKPLLPDDYDERFALSAPEDQRPAQPLRGGEPVELTNMSPSGTLRFNLPKIFLAFRTRIAGRVEEHRAKLVTVMIVPDKMRVSLTWQSALRVSGRDVDYVDKTIIAEKRYLT